MNWSRLKADLRRHEGIRLLPYTDTVGKQTIGVGRNLSDVGISTAEAELMLSNDLDRAFKTARHYIYTFDKLDEVRQEALINMAFNLGNRLSTFQKMRIALGEGNMQEAADECLDSKWAGQVGVRASEIAQRIRTGTIE
jgi:lysozyme